MYGTYPYTATRAKAMKSLLLKKEDYEKLKKMGVSEMARFLGEDQYKRQIEEMAKYHRGVRLVNLALNENLSFMINKLLMISSKEARDLIKLYTGKWVVSNIKVVLRAKINNLGKKELDEIVPIEPTTREFCLSLFDSDNPPKLVKKIIPINYKSFEKFYDEKDMKSLENLLDLSYYSSIFHASKKFPGMLGTFFQNLIILLNIKTIIKLTASGIDKKMLKEFIVGTEIKLLRDMLKADNTDEMIDVLRNSKYATLAKDAEKDITKLENNIEKFLYEYSFSLLHKNPISIFPIFGYLLGKEIEIRNLRLIFNAKSLGLKEDFIDRNLITK